MKINLGIGITCPKCKKQMGSLAHFCNECGTVLPPPSKPVDSKEQAEIDAEFSWKDAGGNCGRMGHMMQAALVNAKFCAVCGTKFYFKNK